MIKQNLKEISHEPTVTRSHLRRNGVNLGTFSVYGYGNNSAIFILYIILLYIITQGYVQAPVT